MAWLPDKTGGKQTPDTYARHLSSLEVEHREKQTRKNNKPGSSMSRFFFKMQGCHMEGGAIWVFSCFNPHFRVKVTHRAKLHLPASIKLISRGVWLYWKPADFWVRVAHGPGAQCAVPINTGSKPSASGARCQNPPLQNALTSFTLLHRAAEEPGKQGLPLSQNVPQWKRGLTDEFICSFKKPESLPSPFYRALCRPRLLLSLSAYFF